ncbi:MAG TPA: hypothetical protein VFF67_08785 [Thermoplasmata archaeon]|nr:hypothetical protein [Thermoplasmata archaeon]
MSEGEDSTADPEKPPELPIAEVVPASAVLAELARGFLLLRESDPRGAARFAATLLKEQSSGPPEVVRPPRPRFPTPSFSAESAPVRR